MNIKMISKMLSIIVLFLIFYFTFGLPSYKEFMRKKVVVDESKITSKEFPSVTICLVREEFKKKTVKRVTLSLKVGR